MKLDTKSLDLAAKFNLRAFIYSVASSLQDAAGGDATGVDIATEVGFQLAGDGTHDVMVRVRLRSNETRLAEEAEDRDDSDDDFDEDCDDD